MAQLNLTETASPNTPASGKVGIYIDNTGSPRIVDDTGATAPLGGAVNFTDLLDVPSSYTGQAGKAVTVNVGETALEFTNPSGSGTVTSVAISGTDGIEVDSGSPITGSGTITLGLNATTIKTTAFPEAVERANNTVLFDQNYIIGNSGSRSGNILFDFTSAKRGAWTEMKHADASAFTFPAEAMLMFDSADISTTVDNYFLFVCTKSSATQIVKVFHALEGGI